MHCRDCDVKWAEAEGAECWMCDKTTVSLETLLERSRKSAVDELTLSESVATVPTVIARGIAQIAFNTWRRA